MWFKVKGCIRFLAYRLWHKRGVRFSPGLGLIGKDVLLGIDTKGATIHLGYRPIIGAHSELLSQGRLTIGNNLNINPYSRIVCHDKISVGSNVLIARYVTILDHDHAYEFKDSKLQFDGYATASITIGNNVWIGDKVTILKGVTIGDNVILGANSLVNKSIPSNCIAVGNPCRVLRELSCDYGS